MSTLTGWGVARLIVGEQPARNPKLKIAPAHPHGLIQMSFWVEEKFTGSPALDADNGNEKQGEDLPIERVLAMMEVLWNGLRNNDDAGRVPERGWTDSVTIFLFSITPQPGPSPNEQGNSAPNQLWH